jgi:replicative DNA helicase
MSLVGKLIHAAIAAGAPTAFRDLRVEQVIEEELPLYNFVARHLRRYGSLPDLTTMAQQGHELPVIRESAHYYLDEIRNRHVFNAINERHRQLVESMRNRDGEEAMRVLREMISTANASAGGFRFSSMAEQVALVEQDHDFARENPGLRGCTLAWETLNHWTLGAMPGDLIVIAGRPSQGKSYALIEVAYQNWLQGRSSAFVSMEMTLLQIARRWVGRASGINPKLIQRGELSHWGEQQFRHTVDAVANSAPVHFLAGDMEKGVEAIEQMVTELDPEIIFVDAAYLLVPSARKRGYVSKWEQIADVIKELKQLAVRHNRPVVITVQLNRNVKSDSKKDLDAGDIAGSDSIPQDASILLGLRKGQAPHEKTQRIVDVIKNREGETGKFGINFQFTPMDFTECPLVTESEPSSGEEVAPPSWMS